MGTKKSTESLAQRGTDDLWREYHEINGRFHKTGQKADAARKEYQRIMKEDPTSLVSSELCKAFDSASEEGQELLDQERVLLAEIRRREADQKTADDKRRRSSGQETLSTLISALRKLVEDGTDPNTLVDTEGCDCEGPCDGVEYRFGRIVLTRNDMID